MELLNDVCLKDYCTYRIGGIAKDLYLPESIDELVQLVGDFRKDARKFWIHGGGANTIFLDGVISMPIVCTKRLEAFSIDGSSVHADAGVILDHFVRDVVNEGLQGAESLSGIPGTLGGAVHMNAGAYGMEISDSLVSVQVLTVDNVVKRLQKDECQFSYRSSAGLDGMIVLSACWKFTEEKKEELQKVRKETLTSRREKQPLEHPSAGSVFKRPVGNYASKLIDEAGLRGTRVGGAEVSTKHAGFIVNMGGATCEDVLALVKICRDRVWEKFAVELEMEQQIIG